MYAPKLSNYLDDVIVSEEFGSEKPNVKNFEYFSDKYDRDAFVYVGDNVKKDPIAPNKLGWHSICLRNNGKNIHEQVFNLEKNQTPKYLINSLSELTNIIDFIMKVSCSY
ncbi:HAD family hydrolase [Mangrovimonas sp. DI 80]|uniref:HAD family hydrolase n=1 Tax=Mangrovimonas sp. DI 80 TaxID=1779330 RepID=UPI0009FA9C94|nr:HAD family hydrolase [Mangrovimonas sp. DI 80]